MIVRIWGCRGSITSPGRETVRYGGESTCIEVRTDEGALIVIDAGSGIRKLGNSLVKEQGLCSLTLLLTHSHWDHLAGFPFFRPAFLPRFTIAVCGGPDACDSVFRSLEHQMDPPYFPVDMSAMRATFSKGCACGGHECGGRLSGTGGALRCESIPLSHPNGGFGFKFTGCSGKPFVFLTDTEIGFRHEGSPDRAAYVDFCRGAELLLHDAQYTDEEYEARTRTWGHSTFRDAMELAIEAGAKRLGFLHHDPDRSDDELDRILEASRAWLVAKGNPLECFMCAEGQSFEL